MARFKVTIIPKWTGSIPTALTNGITIGTVKIIAATECKKKPIINKNIFKQKSRKGIQTATVNRALDIIKSMI